MPVYRIYRMKDAPRQQFRWAPHVSGCAGVKPRDYEQCGTVEAAHEYDAWRLLRDSEDALIVGDLLETDAGQLRICKYVGFDAAQWVLPEPKTRVEATPAAPGTAAEPAPAGSGPA